MKRKLLFAAMFIASAFSLNAQVYFETDLTKQFPVDYQGWTNATGFVGWAAPQVTTNDGRKTAACERFDGSNATTDKVFYRTLTGLSNGTYRIELYGAAASTKGRDTGINSDMTSENEGDETAVYLYATTAAGTVKQYIPVHWATDFNGSGIATAVLDGVEVTDGSIEIGMFSEKKYTNWHVIQIKGVTATVDAIPLYNAALVAAQAVDQSAKMSTAALTGLQTAISTYGAVESTDPEDYRTAIDALEAATAFANKSINSYKVIAAGVIPDNSLDGWTCSNTNDFVINTWSVEGNAGNDPSGMVTPFIQNWVGKGSFLGAGSVSYTLEGLEPGEVYYAQALVRSYNEASSDAPNGPDFFINDAVTSLADAGTTFTYNGMSGIYATLGGAATVGADGKLTLGVEIADDRNYNWVAFKNVTIRPMADALNAAIEKAEALYPQLPASAKGDLEAVVSVNDQAWTTSEEFENAIAAIEAAVATAQPFVAPYAAWTEAKATADELFAENAKLKALVSTEADNADNATSVDEITDATAAVKALVDAYKEWIDVKEKAEVLVAEHAKLTAFVATQAAAVNNASTTDDITAASAAVKEVVAIYKEWVAVKANADVLVAADNDDANANSDLNDAIDDAANAVANTDNVNDITYNVDGLIDAMTKYAKNANPVGDAQFDLTFMLTNPDVTEFWKGDDNGGINGNPDDHAAWGVKPEGWYNDQDGGNFQVMTNKDMADGGEVFMEYWNGAAATSGFVLYQKVTLPEGTYKMTGRVGLNQNVGGTTANMTFSANETDGTQIAVGKLADQEVEFVNTVEQEVKIGIKAHEGNCYRWIGINNIKLFKLPEAAPVTLDENAAYDYTYAGAASAQLTRTISEGFNTVMLPFSLTADEVAEYLGEGQLYSFSSADLGVLNFASSTSLLPNTPYLFKANAANNIENVEIAGRTFVAATDAQVAAAGADYNFVGTFAPLAAGNDVITAADFVLGADKFVIAKGGNALKAFRAFIQANEEVAPVKALTINLDGVATAIEAIDGKAIANGAIYNLAGQRVSKAQKGIFIQNGKKVIK